MQFTSSSKRGVLGRHSEIRYINWTPPDDGWWKLNTDAVSKGNPGLAECDGLIRDSSGRWITVFA